MTTVTTRPVGIDISTEYPRRWTDEVAQTVDVIVTTGCGDACPISAGKHHLDRDVPSPTGQALDALAEILDDVRTRVEALIGSLGLMA